jgi:hypothetical protein
VDAAGVARPFRTAVRQRYAPDRGRGS